MSCNTSIQAQTPTTLPMLTPTSQQQTSFASLKIKSAADDAFWQGMSAEATTVSGDIQHMLTGRNATLWSKIGHVPYALLQGVKLIFKGDLGVMTINVKGITKGFEGKNALKQFRHAGFRHIRSAGYDLREKTPFRKEIEDSYADLSDSEVAIKTRKAARERLSQRSLQNNPELPEDSKAHKDLRGKIYKTLPTPRNRQHLAVPVTAVMRMTAPRVR